MKRLLPVFAFPLLFLSSACERHSASSLPSHAGGHGGDAAHGTQGSDAAHPGTIAAPAPTGNAGSKDGQRKEAPGEGGKFFDQKPAK